MAQGRIRDTNIREKLGASIVNTVFAGLLSLPFCFVWGLGLGSRLAFAMIFFALQLGFLLWGGNRDLGMRFVKSYWKEEYPFHKHFWYNVFYTMSFTTLLIWIWIPFDLLLINLLSIQLPMVLTTGNTLHGWFGGQMKTIVRVN